MFNYITKTCLYNSDPLKPHFYIVKLGFTGVYIIFLISTSTHNICFEQKCEKYQNFLSDKFHFLVVKISVYLNRHVFVMNTVYAMDPNNSFIKKYWCIMTRVWTKYEGVFFFFFFFLLLLLLFFQACAQLCLLCSGFCLLLFFFFFRYRIENVM